MENVDANCFLKINQINNQEKDLFYMSPDKSNENKSILSSGSHIKDKIKSSENNSTILELSNNFIKMNTQYNEDDKNNNVYNILNTTSNIINNNLHKLNNDEILSDKTSDVSNIDIENFKNNKYIINDNVSNNTAENISLSNESLLQFKFINDLKKNNNKIIEIN
jgi:hypothetical protein